MVIKPGLSKVLYYQKFNSKRTDILIYRKELSEKTFDNTVIDLLLLAQ